jgi:uncharacterized protein
MRATKILLAGLVVLLTITGAASSSALSDGVVAFRRGDYATAAKMLLPLSRRGQAEAQAVLGFMYEYGRGVPQDAVLAAHWYVRAAEQGNVSAQFQLGLLYDKGHGVPQSAVIAYKWLNLAAARARPSQQDYYLRIRDAVASKLDAAQLAHAQWLCANWAPKRQP